MRDFCIRCWAKRFQFQIKSDTECIFEDRNLIFKNLDTKADRKEHFKLHLMFGNSEKTRRRLLYFGRKSSVDSISWPLSPIPTNFGEKNQDETKKFVC